MRSIIQSKSFIIQEQGGFGVVCKGEDLVQDILFKIALDGVKCIFLLEAFQIRLLSLWIVDILLYK